VRKSLTDNVTGTVSKWGGGRKPSSFVGQRRRKNSGSPNSLSTVEVERRNDSKLGEGNLTKREGGRVGLKRVA